MDKLENKAQIIFRDRALKKEETYHHYCENCGAEVVHDLIHGHRCKESSVPEVYPPEINETDLEIKCFLETYREILNGKVTGEYMHFGSDKNGEQIVDIRDGKPVPEAAEIDKYIPLVEKFMNDNTSVQSIKLEIKV